MALALQALVTGVLWMSAALDATAYQTAIAVSLATVLIVGPLQILASFAPTEVQLLPVSKRDLWRTGWWLSAMVIPGISLGAKLAGFCLASVLGSGFQGVPPTIWLSSLLDIAYAGAFLGTVPATHATAASRLKLLPKHVRIPVFALGIATALLLFAWPLVAGTLLPTQWNQVSGATAAVLVLGLGLTLFGYFRSPSRLGTPNRAALRAGWQRPSRHWVTEFPRVSGIWRIALQTWKSAMLMQVMLPVLVIGSMIVVAPFLDDKPDGWLDFARDSGFLPFNRLSEPHERWNLAFMYFMGSAGMAWPLAMLGYNDVFQFMIRHLRSLPMSTRQLGASILAVPLVSWVNLYLLLAVIHVVVIGRSFESFRLAEFFALAGIDALVRAMYLRFRTYLWPGILGISALGAGFIVTKIAFGPIPPVSISIGILTFASAWSLNYYTLTRTRLVYTRTTVLSRFAAGLPQE